MRSFSSHLTDYPRPPSLLSSMLMPMPLYAPPGRYKQWEEQKAQERLAASGGAEAKSTSGGAVVTRALQRARAETDEAIEAANKAFKPFAGAAKRIDGRPASTVAEGKESEGKDGRGDGSSSSSSSSSSGAKGLSLTAGSASASAASATASGGGPGAPSGPTYQSRIGDKFSKKKAVLNALKDPAQKFAGAGHKLAEGPGGSSSGGGSGGGSGATNGFGHK